MAHVGAFIGRIVEDSTYVGDWFVVRPATRPDQIEKVLNLRMVGNDLALVVKVEEVVGVQAVSPVDGLVGIDVAKSEEHPLGEAPPQVGQGPLHAAL